MICEMCKDDAEFNVSWFRKSLNAMTIHTLCSNCTGKVWDAISAVPKFNHDAEGECTSQKTMGFNGTEAHLTFTLEPL